MYQFLFLFLLISSDLRQAQAGCLPEDQIPNQYLVRLKKPTEFSTASAVATQTRKNIESDFKGRSLNFRKIFDSGVSFSKTNSVNSIQNLPPTTFVVNTQNISDLSFLQAHYSIESVEQDCKVHLFSNGFTTNDPMATDQWGLDKIKAREAWDITQGNAEIIVAVSDTGVDYLHEDLKNNMWINPKETVGNGIDDDRNGYIDDIYGADVAENSGDPMPPADSRPHLHGTHVAGIIGAVGNNLKGVSGVAPQVKIMAIKGFANYLDGVTDGAHLLDSIYYAVNNGARVINCSWGRKGTPLSAETDAFQYALSHGVVVVAAAGNSTLDAGGFSPASIPGVITVGASDRNDQIADFSNWGTRVDVLAPGGKGYDNRGNMIDSILSTFPRSQGTYGSLMGTSMAAPFVSGLAALILSINPKLKPADVLDILKRGGDLVTVTTLGMKFTYPRINALNSVNLAKTTLAGSTDSTGDNGSQCQTNDPQCTKANGGQSPTIFQKTPSLNSAGGCGLTLKRQSLPLPFDLAVLFFPALFTVYLRTRRLSFSRQTKSNNECVNNQ